MSRRQKERILDSDEEEGFGMRNSRNERSRSRSRSRSNQRRVFQDDDESQEQNHSQEQMSSNSHSSKKNAQINVQTYAIQIREAILDFFGKVKQEKGFVFTPQDRAKKLINEQQRYFKKNKNHKKIKWTPVCQWIQENQKKKIDEIFTKQASVIPQEKVPFLKGIFLNSSYLFGQETTEQLYLILMRIAKIALQKEDSPLTKVRQFMSFVLNDTTEFKFFNFKFSSYYKLPPNNESNEQIYHQFGQHLYKEVDLAIKHSG